MILPISQYSTVLSSNGTVQYSTVQYSTVQYSTVQYSTVQYLRQYWMNSSSVTNPSPSWSISWERIQTITLSYYFNNLFIIILKVVKK